jgi:hypothetical protein
VYSVSGKLIREYQQKLSGLYFIHQPSIGCCAHQGSRNKPIVTHSPWAKRWNLVANIKHFCKKPIVGLLTDIAIVFLELWFWTTAPYWLPTSPSTSLPYLHCPSFYRNVHQVNGLQSFRKWQPRNCITCSEPRGPLPCSQKLAIKAYPEPEKFTPHIYVPFFNISLQDFRQYCRISHFNHQKTRLSKTKDRW